MPTNPNSSRSKETWQSRAVKSLWTFLTIAAAIIFYYFIQYLGEISAFVGGVISSLGPVICGLIIAYLLNPIATFYEKHIAAFLSERVRRTERVPKISRTIGSFLAVFTAIAFLSILGVLVVPEITASIKGLVSDLPKQVSSLMNQLQSRSFFDNDSPVGQYANEALLSAMQSFEDWLMSDLTSLAERLLGYFYTGVKSAFNVVYNLIIGLVLSIYVLIDKYRIQRQIKQLTYSVFPTETATQVRRVLGQANKKFSSAILGKSFDSIIIGLLCFTLLSILNLLPFFEFPYPVLLAVIVGVTNVVPFFGPFVGGFITAVLVLFDNPSMVIPYVLMIVVLQQFDCNYLDPHIVGNSIGLRPFYSICAVLLGSAIFGIPGFIIGQPVFAFIYEIVSEWSESRLRAKHLEEEFDIPPEVDFEDFAEKDEAFTASLLQEEPVEEPVPRRKFVSKETLHSILQKRRNSDNDEKED
ncbi:MAG: AI-2E family transporter [Ruminococcus sp.]|nr:AI-2E family transporter [Ruminococcus sp.]